MSFTIRGIDYVLPCFLFLFWRINKYFFDYGQFVSWDILIYNQFVSMRLFNVDAPDILVYCQPDQKKLNSHCSDCSVYTFSCTQIAYSTVLEKRTQEVVLENVCEDSWVKLNPGTVSNFNVCKGWLISWVEAYACIREVTWEDKRSKHAAVGYKNITLNRQFVSLLYIFLKRDYAKHSVNLPLNLKLRRIWKSCFF